MEQVTEIQNTNFKRFDIPLKFGLLAGIVKIVLSTIQYQFFLGNWIGTMLFSLLSLIVGIGIMCLSATNQRKAMGGYISMKDAFQSIFIVILIMVVFSTIYDWIYLSYIDPSMMDKLKDSSISFAQKMGAPEEKLDEMAKQFDEQAKDKANIKNMSLGLLYQIIMYSIVGFICAAVIKRKPADI
jgi:hypothetical protein